MKKLLIFMLLVVLLFSACAKQPKKALPAETEQATAAEPSVQEGPSAQEEPSAPEQPAETPAEPEQPEPAIEPEQEPVLEQQPEQEKPSEQAPETVAVPEPVRRMLSVRALVDRVPVQDAFREIDTAACESTCRELLSEYLKSNWDTGGRLLESGEVTLGLFALNDPDAYLAVLMQKNNYAPLSLLIDLKTETVARTTVTVPARTETKISAEIMNLVGGSQYGKNLCRLRYDLELPEQVIGKLDTDISNALYSFEVWLTDHWEDYAQIMTPPFFTEFELSEEGVFTLLLSGETFFRVEMSWLPAKGVWVEGARSEGELDPHWQVPETLLTEQYLVSLVRNLETNMAPEFESPEQLTEAELYKMFLLLSPRSELTASWQVSDKMYHFTNYQITSVLSRYLSGYRYDITQNPEYDAERREIVTGDLHQAQNGRTIRLREKSLDGSFVNAVFEVFGAEDTKKPLYIKQYRLEFIYGGYQYCSVEKVKQ